jgi:methylated-DNA-[protein]-cysteine S-methyltransferase
MNGKTIQSPIGELTVVSDGEFVTHIYFHCEATNEKIQRKDTPVLQAAAKQLGEYFEGRRKTFDVPLKLSGCAFHKKVWEVMIAKVPFGSTISYSEIAKMVGSPKAARAVGAANNRNPIPIIVPCHRVVGKSGKLTGFRAGLDIKEKLLELERRKI